MLEVLKQWFKMRRWRKSVLGEALQEHGYGFFWAKNAPFGYLDEAQKLEHCAALHAMAMEITESDNPLASVRESLASYVLTFAPLMVSGLKLEEEGHEAEVFNSPYISAQLRPHIAKIVDSIDELGKVKFDDPDSTDEELASYCSTRASLLLFYCNGINMISIHVENRIGQNVSWYQAFVQASLIHAEDSIREDIGLPSLLPNPTDSLVYSSFLNYVLAGEPDPYFSWCKAFPDRQLLGRGKSSPA